MPNTESAWKGRQVLLAVFATLLGSLWPGGTAQACCPGNGSAPGTVALVPEAIAGTPDTRQSTPGVALGALQLGVGVASASPPPSVFLRRPEHFRERLTRPFRSVQLKHNAPGSNIGGGKLVERDAFSGKMLDAAVPDTQGTRKITRDSSGGISTQVEKTGAGSRRILWRQIQ